MSSPQENSPVPNLSPRRLWSSVGLSVLLAAIVFVLFVLPAEYGVDPTGSGKLMGIDGMSAYEVNVLTRADMEFVEDEVEFYLAPFESVEYKYEMHAGDAIVYGWSAEAEVVFDLHGHEPGADEDDSVSFAIGRSPTDNGTYVAPYNGEHGWFWENRGTTPVTVKLSAVGYMDASITYGPQGEYRRSFAGEPLPD